MLIDFAPHSESDVHRHRLVPPSRSLMELYVQLPQPIILHLFDLLRDNVFEDHVRFPCTYMHLRGSAIPKRIYRRSPGIGPGTEYYHTEGLPVKTH